jgi:hypothetical protein
MSDEQTVVLWSIACLVAALAIFGCQCVHWLHYAQWPPVTVRTFLGNPVRVEWEGVHIVIGWLLDIPVASVLFVAGLVFSGSIKSLGRTR